MKLLILKNRITKVELEQPSLSNQNIKPLLVPMPNSGYTSFKVGRSVCSLYTTTSLVTRNA